MANPEEPSRTTPRADASPQEEQAAKAGPRPAPIGAVPTGTERVPPVAWRELRDEAARQLSTLRAAGLDLARAVRALARTPGYAMRLLRRRSRPAGA